MDNTREKLIELIGSTKYGSGSLVGKNFQEGFIAKIADHLIANGVTVQKWIPVTERLPDTQEYDWVLAQITMIPSFIYGVPVVAELRADGWYDAYDNLIDGKYEKVTHWMPLPEPPSDP